jgi:nitrogen fixation/metabolism regulation signal transduction histidine kinase
MICPSPRYINDENYYGGFSQNDIDDLMETLDSNYLGWSSAMAPVIMGNANRPELAEELEHSFCQNNPEIAKHFVKVTFLGDNRSDIERLTNETLIIQSKTDAIASNEVGEYVLDNIINSELVTLDTTGHCPHLNAPDDVILMAKDNGLGIDLKKYGDRLFRLNNTFHRHPDSKGVGLYMIKTQIEAIGGSISVESEEDKGTTFKIILKKNI